MQGNETIFQQPIYYGLFGFHQCPNDSGKEIAEHSSIILCATDSLHERVFKHFRKYFSRQKFALVLELGLC